MKPDIYGWKARRCPVLLAVLPPALAVMATFRDADWKLLLPVCTFCGLFLLLAEYQDDKRQNRLRPQDIEKIVGTYKAYQSVPKYAHRATIDEIRENEFNLNIPRYVDTSEEEKEIDVAAIQKEIDGLEVQLAATRAEMAKYLKELGFTK